MIHMTKRFYDGSYVVLGAELLNEFRNNGSANSVQQKIVNPSNGFTWLSEYDYRGLIKPDGVYYISFGAYCDGCDNYVAAPLFNLECSYKYTPAETVHYDPFPNAVPEIRNTYKRDETVFRHIYVPMGVDESSPTNCKYDGIKR